MAKKKSRSRARNTSKQPAARERAARRVAPAGAPLGFGDFTEPCRVGVVAPSSVVPSVEFELGIEQLRADGFDVKVHRQCRKKHLFFAGTAQDRAEAFYEYAMDPEVDVLWSARGGYGANHLLPLLDRLTAEKGVPPSKLLVGFSDATALLEFVRSRWGWRTLHAPMPAARAFTILNRVEHESLVRWVRGLGTREPWGARRLKFIGSVRPEGPLDGEMVGGNLAVWNILVGTPYAPKVDGKILFLEEIGETFSKIDRMVHHIRQSGGFDGVRAIVLGDFLDCNDHAPTFLARRPSVRDLEMAMKSPRPQWLAPIRKAVPARRALAEIFGTLGDELGIPVAAGLPAGHGPGHSPVPLGARYQLSPAGNLQLMQWDWLGG